MANNYNQKVSEGPASFPQYAETHPRKDQIMPSFPMSTALYQARPHVSYQYGGGSRTQRRDNSPSRFPLPPDTIQPKLPHSTTSGFGDHMTVLPPIVPASGLPSMLNHVPQQPLILASHGNPEGTKPSKEYKTTDWRSTVDDHHRGPSPNASHSTPSTALQIPDMLSPQPIRHSTGSRPVSTGSSGSLGGTKRLGSRGEAARGEDRSWFDEDCESGRGNDSRKHSPSNRPMSFASESEFKHKDQLTVEDPAAFPSKFSREDQIADILSSFKPCATSPNPSSTTPFHRTSFSSSHNPLEDVGVASFLNLSVAPSLPATIYGLAVSNPSFFQVLRQAVPPEYCAISFFKRVEGQVYAICRKYSDYLFSGPSAFEFTGHTNGMSSSNGLLAEDEEMCVPDESWCEKALKRRVCTIRRHLEMRKPLGRVAKEQALQALVRILWEVVEKGGYEDGAGARANVVRRADGDRRRRAIQDHSSVGIYGRLIGKGGVALMARASARSGAMNFCGPWPLPANMSSPNRALQVQQATEGEHFVISAMWEVIEAAGPFMDKLRRILGRIKTYGAREGYVEEFERFLLSTVVEVDAHRQSAASATSSGSLGPGVGAPVSDNTSPSRRNSVDSTKRTRRLSTDGLERAASKRRVS